MVIRLLIALVTAIAALSGSLALATAAVDVNKADQATLETLKGVGPAMSGKILDERKKGAFKSWEDLIERVRGVGPGNASRFAAEGLTVNGTGYGSAPVAAAANKSAKADTGPSKGGAEPAAGMGKK